MANDSLGKGVYLLDTASKKIAHVFPNDSFAGQNQQSENTESTWASFDGMGSIDTVLTDESPKDRRIKTDSLMLLTVLANDSRIDRCIHLAKGIETIYIKDTGLRIPQSLGKAGR